LIFAKTNLQHLGETFGEYPFFYYFSRTLLTYNIKIRFIKLKDEEIFY